MQHARQAPCMNATCAMPHATCASLHIFYLRRSLSLAQPSRFGATARGPQQAAPGGRRPPEGRWPGIFNLRLKLDEVVRFDQRNLQIQNSGGGKFKNKLHTRSYSYVPPVVLKCRKKLKARPRGHSYPALALAVEIEHILVVVPLLLGTSLVRGIY